MTTKLNILAEASPKLVVCLFADEPRWFFASLRTTLGLGGEAVGGFTKIELK
jgi:hypothetical protein